MRDIVDNTENLVLASTISVRRTDWLNTDIERFGIDSLLETVTTDNHVEAASIDQPKEKVRPKHLPVMEGNRQKSARLTNLAR